jgi:hypothetical protein
VKFGINVYYYTNAIIISIQPLGRFWPEPEPSQMTGMALARCILGKFLGVVCHCFPLIPTYAQINRIKLIIKLLRHVSVLIHHMFTPDQRTTNKHARAQLTRNYIRGHIYQDVIITTHYCIVLHHFNNS